MEGASMTRETEPELSPVCPTCSRPDDASGFRVGTAIEWQLPGRPPAPFTVTYVSDGTITVEPRLPTDFSDVVLPVRVRGDL